MLRLLGCFVLTCSAAMCATADQVLMTTSTVNQAVATPVATARTKLAVPGLATANTFTAAQTFGSSATGSVVGTNGVTTYPVPHGQFAMGPYRGVFASDDAWQVNFNWNGTTWAGKQDPAQHLWGMGLENNYNGRCESYWWYTSADNSVAGLPDYLTVDLTDHHVRRYLSGDLILANSPASATLGAGVGPGLITTAANQDLAINPNGTGVLRLYGEGNYSTNPVGVAIRSKTYPLCGMDLGYQYSLNGGAGAPFIHGVYEGNAWLPLCIINGAGTGLGTALIVGGTGAAASGATLDVQGNVTATTLNLSTVPTYANNAAARAGGLVTGQIYHTGGDPDVLCITHNAP